MVEFVFCVPGTHLQSDASLHSRRRSRGVALFRSRCIGLLRSGVNVRVRSVMIWTSSVIEARALRERVRMSRASLPIFSGVNTGSRGATVNKRVNHSGGVRAILCGPRVVKPATKRAGPLRPDGWQRPDSDRTGTRTNGRRRSRRSQNSQMSGPESTKEGAAQIPEISHTAKEEVLPYQHIFDLLHRDSHTLPPDREIDVILD